MSCQKKKKKKSATKGKKGNMVKKVVNSGEVNNIEDKKSEVDIEEVNYQKEDLVVENKISDEDFKKKRKEIFDLARKSGLSYGKMMERVRRESKRVDAEAEKTGESKKKVAFKELLERVKTLNFDDDGKIKEILYEEQDGACAYCSEKFKVDDLELTTYEGVNILICKDCIGKLLKE